MTELLPIKSSSINYEPYQILGESSAFHLWRVEIDGELFSKTMSPFGASDDRVERYGCTTCSVFGDGSGFYAVRRVGDRIVWFYEELLDSNTLREFGNLPEVYIFGGKDYDAVVGSGTFANLPVLNDSEMRALLLSYLPSPSLALYVNSDCPGEVDGRELLCKVSSALSGDGDISYQIDPPEVLFEIRIGLELPDLPECHWFIGKSDSGTSVLFSEFPKMPCWVDGEQISEVFNFAGV